MLYGSWWFLKKVSEREQKLLKVINKLFHEVVQNDDDDENVVIILEWVFFSFELLCRIVYVLTKQVPIFLSIIFSFFFKLLPACPSVILFNKSLAIPRTRFFIITCFYTCYIGQQDYHQKYKTKVGLDHKAIMLFHFGENNISWIRRLFYLMSISIAHLPTIQYI